METIKCPKTETQVIQAILLKAAAPCSIYIFGCRNEPNAVFHFDILVFANTKVTGSHLMNEIKELSSKTITATVLVHNVQHLATKQKSQQHFFDQVLRKGQRLALDKTNVPYIENHNPERDLESDTRYWHKCVAATLFNLQCAKDNPQADVELCKVALLNLSCIQIALGLIRLFMGYRPNEFGLKYILQLCGHFTDLPEQVFAQSTENDKRLYKMLCAPAGLLLHWTVISASETDVAILQERTQTFLDRAEELATTELNRLITLTT
jgi:hypothetical protein